MPSTTRSGRPHAARSTTPLRASKRQKPARITAAQSFTAAQSITPAQFTAAPATIATQHPIHRDQPSWEELFGRR